MVPIRERNGAPSRVTPLSPRGSPRRGGHLRHIFDHFAGRVTLWSGSPFAFGMAAGAVLVWLACGPVFHYSETWQLVINTGTTIITFLMVFLIQQSQNKDSHALHLKLDELLCAIQEADNSLVDIEDMEEEEIAIVAKRYQNLAERAKSAKQEKAGQRAQEQDPPESARREQQDT